MKWNRTKVKLPTDDNYNKFMITVVDGFDRMLVIGASWDGIDFYKICIGTTLTRCIYPIKNVIAWIELPSMYEGDE